MNKSATPYILVNILLLALTLVMNYLATALPIAGRTPAEVSDMFPTLFTPAGFTFAIWGFIYLLLIGFAVYQARFWGKEAPAFLKKISWFFALSCAANTAWILAFHHLQIGLSLILTSTIFISLLVIYLRINDGQTLTTKGERWLVRLPFSVYLGWVTVATIANAALFFTQLGWNGEPGGPQFWTVVVIATAVVIGLTALLKRNDFAYPLVIVWALYGIYSNRIHDLGTEDGMVEIATMVGMATLALGMGYRLIKLAK